jgi:hypothetical protein
MLLRDTRREKTPCHRFRAHAYAVLITTILAAAPVGASGELRGVVVDENGAENWYSHIIIRNDLAGRPSGTKSEVRTFMTARTGRFTVPSLQPGFYDLCVLADGYQPTCRKIKIVDGKPLDVRITIKGDGDVLDSVAEYIGTGEVARPKR